MYLSYHNVEIIYISMLIYTRGYNKHSITEYLINSISIYQLFVWWFEQARTTPLWLVILSRVQYMIMSVRLYRGHARLICFHYPFWRRRTATQFSEEIWCFPCHKSYAILSVTWKSQVSSDLWGLLALWAFRKIILLLRNSCSIQWVYTLILETFQWRLSM